MTQSYPGVVRFPFCCGRANSKGDPQQYSSNTQNAVIEQISKSLILIKFTPLPKQPCTTKLMDRNTSALWIPYKIMGLSNVSLATIGTFILISKARKLKKSSICLDIRKLVIFLVAGISGGKTSCGEDSIRKEDLFHKPMILHPWLIYSQLISKDFKWLDRIQVRVIYGYWSQLQQRVEEE